MILVLVVMLAFADIAVVKLEPLPERRSELALANADRAIDEARKAYLAGDDNAAKAAAAEVQESVEVSYDALLHTHGQPRGNKYYKRAELKVRALLRRLDGLRQEVGFDSHASIDAVSKRLSEVHDQLLNAIMSKKKA